MDNIELTQPTLHYLEPPLLMRNIQGKFVDVSALSGQPFHLPRAARGVAFGDWNNDGLMDLAINCTNRSALILQNNGAGAAHWLTLETVGTKSNRDGIGANIRVVLPNGTQQYGFVNTAGSYASSNERRSHFGLG